MLPSACPHLPETASSVCAACLRYQLSAILSNQSPESSLPSLGRSSSRSSAPVGFEESIKNVVERSRRSCDVKVENVSVDKCGVNENVDVVFREKGWDRVGCNGGYGFDDDLDWGLGGEVKTMKELIDADRRNKKNKKKDEKEVDLGRLWQKASAIRKRFSKWKMQSTGSKGNGDVSSFDDFDLSKEVVKLREKDLTEVTEFEDKVSRRSCDAVLVSDGRGSFDSCGGLANKPHASLDVNLVQRSSGFRGLKLAVSDVSDVKEVDNLFVKRSANGKNLKPVVRSGVGEDYCVQDSDDSCEGFVSKRLRRGLDRIISNMKVLSPLQVKKVRETSSSRSSPNGAKPVSKLLITEKELMEWSSKTRDCSEDGVGDSAGCAHSHYVNATQLQLSTVKAKRSSTGSNKESPPRRNQCTHYSPCSLANGMPKFAPASSIEKS